MTMFEMRGPTRVAKCLKSHINQIVRCLLHQQQPTTTHTATSTICTIGPCCASQWVAWRADRLDVPQLTCSKIKPRLNNR